MNPFFRAFLSLSVLAVSMCAVSEPLHPRIKIDVEPGVNPWSNLDFNDNADNFQFAVVADRTGRARVGVFEDAIAKLNLLQPEFVMSVGDLIQGGIEDVHEIDMQWDELLGFVHELDMPFFHVPGNHDISNQVMARVWKKRFGRSYYHFVYKDVLFLCLNTEDPPRAQMSDAQVEYVRKALAENPDVRWTLVFLHKPMWTYEDPNGFEKIESLLRGRKYTVIAGHTHDYVKYVRHDSRYLVLATTGGGSELRGPIFGEFDHLVWVTMTDEGPVVANLMLEGIWDENIRDASTAEAIQKVLSGAVLSSGSLIVEGTRFDEATTNLRVENVSDVPMTLMACLHPNGSLAPEPASFEITLPPNTLESVPIQLNAKGTQDVRNLPSVWVDWKVRYEFTKHEPIELEGGHAIVVDSVFECPQLERGVKIDGELGEWGSLPFQCGPPVQITSGADVWNGVEDASFRFAVGRDDSNLYIAIEATDDVPNYDASRKGWDRDGYEIRLDARPDPERSRGRGKRTAITKAEYGEFLWLTLSPGETQAETLFFSHNKLPEGIQAAAAPSDNGHTAEIAIPFSYLNMKQEKEWTHFRLNFNKNDRDDEESPMTKLYWRPDWRTGSNFTGSGTFRRK